MNAYMKSLLAASCLLAFSCSSSSDDNKSSDETPVANPTPTPTPAPTDVPVPGEPVSKGFRFVNDADVELPIFVRGGMNGWLGDNVSEELLAASRLNFDATTGCYLGTLSLEAGEIPFRLATYLADAQGTGWSHLKVGLGAAGTSAALTLGEETKVDVYYFPAGDANGKDFGGGGNFTLNFPKKGDYEFKFCTNADDYTTSFLTVSDK